MKSISMQIKEKPSLYNIFFVILLLLCFLSYAWKIFHGFDIDEQYAISMMWRFSIGDRYLIDVFDPYQFSAYLMFPLWKASAFFFRNPLFGYRSLCVLITVLISVYIFFSIFVVSNNFYFSFLFTLVWFTALPKSIVSIEHSRLLYVFLSILLINIYHWSIYNDRQISIGLCFVAISLCYPTMVLIGVLILALFIYKKDYVGILKIFIVCICFLLIFLIPLYISIGGKGVLNSIRVVLMDGSHKASLKSIVDKSYNEFKTLFIYCIKILLCFIVYKVITQFSFVKKYIKCSDLCAICSIPFLLIIFQLIFQKIFPLYDYSRYLLMLIVGCTLKNNYRKEPILFLKIIIALVFAISYFSSNNGFLSASGNIMMSVIFIVIYFYRYKSIRESMIFLTTVLLSQCATMVLSARLSGSVSDSVFSSNLIRNNTYLSSIWIEKNTESVLNSMDSISTKIESENILFCGRDVYFYPLLGRNIYAPVTTATPVYNEQWEWYVKNHYVKKIDLIIESDDLDKDQLIGILKKYYLLEKVQVESNLSLYHLYRVK